jgi:hypothetical protein
VTPLTKPVVRRTRKRVQRRDVVVTLAPAGSQEEALIGLRLAGTRTQYVVSLTDVYILAAQIHARRVAAAKRAARQQGIPWKRAKRDLLRSFDLGGVR